MTITPEELRIGRDACYHAITHGGNRFLFLDDELHRVAAYLERTAEAVEGLNEAIAQQNKDAAVSVVGDV